MAIKKFKESDKDETIRKICVREVKALRQCNHENIIRLEETFKRKDKLHLVFKFVDRTLLDILEKTGHKGIEVLLQFILSPMRSAGICIKCSRPVTIYTPIT